MISQKQAREIATQLGYDVTNKPMRFMQLNTLANFQGTGNAKYLLIGNVSISLIQALDAPVQVDFYLKDFIAGQLVAGIEVYWDINLGLPRAVGGQSPVLFCAFTSVDGAGSVAQFQGWAMRI